MYDSLISQIPGTRILINNTENDTEHLFNFITNSSFIYIHYNM
jgi:hypothetical protein